MLFTRRMDYGLRIMLTLGLDPQARLSAQEVAEQVEVPRPFVLKIIQRLAEAGLVDARRGPGGGATLARETEEVSVLDILRAADSPRALNACLLEPWACSRSGTCAAHRLLRPVQETLDRELEQLTLADLVREQRAIDAG